jgi:outer membrane protein OmpA-like peptidoglycan-associated protein
MTNANDPDRTTHGSSIITPVAGKKKTNWLPWLLAALALLLLLFTLSQCADRDEPEESGATTTTTQSNSTTYPDGSATTSAVGPDGQTTTSVTGPLAAGAAGAATATGAAAPAPLSTGLQPFLASGEPAPRRFTFDRLNFATGSADLPADAGQTIASLAQTLSTYPNAVVRVEGYADARGSEPVNQQLGAERANAVAQALIAAGVPAARVTAVSGGEQNPVDTNATAQGQAENRRTDLVVTAK